MVKANHALSNSALNFLVSFFLVEKRKDEFIISFLGTCDQVFIFWTSAKVYRRMSRLLI